MGYKTGDNGRCECATFENMETKWLLCEVRYSTYYLTEKNGQGLTRSTLTALLLSASSFNERTRPTCFWSRRGAICVVCVYVLAQDRRVLETQASLCELLRISYFICVHGVLNHFALISLYRLHNMWQRMYQCVCWRVPTCAWQGDVQQLACSH